MADTTNGTQVNFAFATAAGITMLGGTDDGAVVTAISGILLQSIDAKKQANRTLVKDGLGDRVTSIHNDRINSASLRWVVSGTSRANAIVNSAISQPGNFVVITDLDTIPSFEHATNRWEIVSAAITGGNESVKEITYELEYAAGIQARGT